MAAISQTKPNQNDPASQQTPATSAGDSPVWFVPWRARLRSQSSAAGTPLNGSKLTTAAMSGIRFIDYEGVEQPLLRRATTIEEQNDRLNNRIAINQRYYLMYAKRRWRLGRRAAVIEEQSDRLRNRIAINRQCNAMYAERRPKPSPEAMSDSRPSVVVSPTRARERGWIIWVGLLAVGALIVAVSSLKGPSTSYSPSSAPAIGSATPLPTTPSPRASSPPSTTLSPQASSSSPTAALPHGSAPPPTTPSLPPHIEFSPQGIRQPADGYEWLSQLDGKVYWKAGTPSRVYAHLIAADTQGDWWPADGYDWVDQGRDKAVKWIPGIPSRVRSNIVAATVEGTWFPAAGYIWVVNPPPPGDFRVRPIGPLGLPSSPPVLDSFREGVADRAALELWVAGSTGDYKRGVDWWAEHRSAPNPGPCSPPEATSLEFISGCQAARARLDPTDINRKTDPEYWRGWNNYNDAPTTQYFAPGPSVPLVKQVAPTPPVGCRRGRSPQCAGIAAAEGKNPRPSGDFRVRPIEIPAPLAPLPLSTQGRGWQALDLSRVSPTGK